MLLFEAFLCILFASWLNRNFHFMKALPDEIKREDDVLLQGTPFISTIAFFYINLLLNDQTLKIAIGLTIVLLTGTFYLFRASAKIRADPKARYDSMHFLVLLATITIYELTVIPLSLYIGVFSLPILLVVLWISGFALIVFLPIALVSMYFPIRYGVQQPKWVRKDNDNTMQNLKASQISKRLSMKNLRFTEKSYLLILSVILIAVSIIMLVFVSPNSLGYDLAISLMSTSLTVFFLDLMLLVREEREWKNVEKYINRMIASENTLITSELLRYLEPEENESLFKLSLSQTNDSKLRSDMIISRLRVLQKKEDLKLSPYAYNNSLNKESLKVLSEVKSRLADIQIKYGRQLRDPVLVEKIQKLQDGIDLLTLSGQLGNSLPKMQSQVATIQNTLKSLDVNAPIFNIIKNADMKDFDTLTQTAVEIPIRALLNEIIELWDMGITFNII